MDNHEYKKKLQDLGFNFASYARFCGVNRSTVMRHCTGAIEPIPYIYIRVLEWIEEGKLEKPKPKDIAEPKKSVSKVKTKKK